MIPASRSLSPPVTVFSTRTVTSSRMSESPGTTTLYGTITSSDSATRLRTGFPWTTTLTRIMSPVAKKLPVNKLSSLNKSSLPNNWSPFDTPSPPFVCPPETFFPPETLVPPAETMPDLRFHDICSKGAKVLGHMGNKVAEWVPTKRRMGWAFSDVPIPRGKKVIVKLHDGMLKFNPDIVDVLTNLVYFTFIDQDPNTFTENQIAGKVPIIPIKDQEEVLDILDIANDKLIVALVNTQPYAVWMDKDEDFMNVTEFGDPKKIARDPLSNQFPLNSLRRKTLTHVQNRKTDKFWLAMRTDGNLSLEFLDLDTV